MGRPVVAQSSESQDSGGIWTRPSAGARRCLRWVAGVALLALLGGGPVDARGGHWHGTSLGISVGVPLTWPYYGWPYDGWGYDWPYDQAPGAVILESAPTHYVERGAPQGSDGGDGWWYYCRQPRGYYPDVPKCLGGWEKVAPNPSD